jgi:uncharacterized repeat protein (TIGR03803 family)
MRTRITHYVAAPLAAWLIASHALAAPPARFMTVFPIPGFNDGAAPVSALIEHGGVYYGTASSGGDNGGGTVFKIDPASGKETTLYSFGGGNDGTAPLAPMIDYHGKLYGTTLSGGPAGGGTVFQFDPATGTESVLCSFPGGLGGLGPSAPIVAYRGNFYGTTTGGGTTENGVIFKVDPATGALSTLYTFGTSGAQDGLAPHAGLIVLGDTLYGTTSLGGQTGGGTVFSFDPATNIETSLYALQGTDGSGPDAPLLALNGVLYGTASQGGSSNNGTVFSVTPATGAHSLVYSFTGGTDGAFPMAGLIAIGGTLYGTTTGFNSGGFGSVFAIDPASGAETTLYSFTGGYDGGQPEAALLENGGTLIGVTSAGGFNNNGVAFSVNPATMTESVLHQFSGSDTLSTASGLIRAGNTLYGSATGAGTLGYGAIFGVDAKSGAGTIVYSFKGGNDGLDPTGMLVDQGGNLYGTTMRGGLTDQGTVFKLDAARNRTTLHDFAGGKDGAQPEGGLIAAGNLLYGTTYEGGTAGSGTIFAIDPATGISTTLYTFTGGADGELPWAPLINVKGTLYGTTLDGGVKNSGVVFAFDIKHGTEKTVYAFKGKADGATPFAPLISAGGMLYGTTSGYGSPLTGGTVFSLDPTTGAETVLYRFTQFANGTMPIGGVTERGGVLYGTTSSGGLGYGTIFSLDPTSGTEMTLYSFTGGADSGLPEASLLKVGHALWGTTFAGTGNAGTVFELKP